MADGSRLAPQRLSAEGSSFAAAQLKGAFALWARCACGNEAAIDPKPWIAQGLDGQPLAMLEDRLRCNCGARRARLEIRGQAEGSAGGGIHVFR